MKKTLLSVFASGMVLLAYSQNPTPPKEVQNEFSKKYTSVEKLEWEQEDNEWEAEFKQNGKEMTAVFDNSGKWLETEKEVNKKEVPAEIFKAINLQFEGWEIEDIEWIEKPDFKGYEIVLENEDTETEIQVTEVGEITIKNVKLEDEEEHEGESEKDED